MARRKVKCDFKVFVVKFLVFAVVAVIMFAVSRVIGELMTAAKVVEMGGEFVSEALTDAIDVVED